MGANASREFQYAETETQQLTRLDQIACGNIAQCYLELGQFRKALDFNAKFVGRPVLEDRKRRSGKIGKPQT